MGVPAHPAGRMGGTALNASVLRSGLFALGSESQSALSMKLEKELVRGILLAVESHEGSVYEAVPLAFDDFSDRHVAYHVMLLCEAGYLVGEDLSCMGSDLEWEAQRLTYAGHEFLDTIRDAEVWRRTKDAAGKVGGASLQVVLELGKTYVKQVLVERTGIALP